MLKFLNWNLAARLLQMLLVPAGVYLIGKGWATQDLWDRTSAIVIEFAAVAWAIWHGTSPQRHNLVRRTARALKKGPPPTALVFLALLPMLAGCALWRSIVGDNGLLAEKAAVVACAGSDAAMDVLLLANGGTLVPNSLLCHLNGAKQKVALACSLGHVAGAMSPTVTAAMDELKIAKAQAVARMPPRTVGTFLDALIDLILRGAPNQENVNAARLSMQAALTLTSKRWDDRIAQACAI